jgi:hypothetical protein
MLDLSPNSNHLLHDFVYALAFLAGQLMFDAKRANMVVRSKVNPVHSYRDFIRLNWIPLVIRIWLGQAIVLYAWRHYTLGQLIHAFGWSWSPSFTIPQTPLAASMLGYLSDSGLDWLSTWQKLPKILREQIPTVQAQISQVVEEKVTTTVATQIPGETVVKSSSTSDISGSSQ